MVDPVIAQLAINDRQRGVYRFAGTTEIELNDFNWKLRLEWRAKATPIGAGSMRGFLGVEHDVQVTGVAIVSTDGRVFAVSADFIPANALSDFVREIELELDGSQWNGGDL